MKLFLRANHKEALACDLKWQVLDPFAEKAFKHDQINQLIAEGYRYSFTYKNGSDINIGVTSSSDFEEFQKLKIYSVAAKVATTKRFQKTTSLILLTNTDQDAEIVFAIGIVSGNIVIDEIVAINEAHLVYEKFVSLCENTGRLFFTHGDVTIPGLPLNHPYTLRELLDDKSGKKVLIEPLRDEKKLLYVVYAVVLLIVFFAAWKAWDWYREDQKNRIRHLSESKNTPAYIYGQSVLIHLNALQLVMPAAGQQIIDMVERFPARTGGWLLETLQCNVEKCDTRWVSEGGTYADFKARSQTDWGELIYSSADKDMLGDLKTIRVSFPHKLEKQKITNPSDWPQADAFTFQTGVEWQKLKSTDWQASLGPAELQAVPQGVTPTAVQSHAQAIHAMPWSTSNQSWPTIKRVLPSFPDNVVIKTFEIRLDKLTQKVTFNASGLAYVKK